MQIDKDDNVDAERSQKAFSSFGNSKPMLITLKILVVSFVLLYSLDKALSYPVSQVLKNKDYYGVLIEFYAESANQALHFLGEESVIRRTAEMGLLQRIQAGDFAASVYVTEESIALAFYAMLCAAVLVWPGAIIKKLFLLVATVGYVFVIDILRVVAMYFIEVFHPALFSVFQMWVMPLVLVFFCVGFFALCVRILGAEALSQPS